MTSAEIATFILGCKTERALEDERAYIRHRISFVPPAEQHLLRVLLMGQHVRVRQ
jgi:hypothetical protein